MFDNFPLITNMARIKIIFVLKLGSELVKYMFLLRAMLRESLYQ